MRKNPPYDANFTLDLLPGAVMEAAEMGMDWKHVHALIKTLAPQGLIDPTAAWDSSGRPLLGALMCCHRSRNDDEIPEDVLDLIVELDPLALSRQDPGGNTPVDLYLDNMAAAGDHSKHLGTGAWWFQHADRAALFAWKPSDPSHPANRDEKPSQDATQNGYYLLHTVLMAEMSRNSRYLEKTLLGELARLGVDLNAASRDKTYCAELIHHATQWEAFIENQGNAFVSVKKHGEKSMPLWRYLVDTTHGEARKAIQAWASVNAAGELDKKLASDYWEKLKSKTSYGPNSQDMPALLRSHEKYLTLRDPEGRTAAMYAIQMHPSAYRILSQKQYVAMNAERDGNGHTLWHYLLSKSKSCTPEMMQFLGTSSTPKDPNPKTGRGFLPSLVLDFKSMQGEHEKYPSDIRAVQEAIVHTTGEQWWAMQPKDEDKVCKWLENNLADQPRREVSACITYLACEFIEHIPNQALRRKLLEENFERSHVNLRAARFFFQQGMADDWKPEQFEKLNSSRLTRTEIQELKTLWEARQIELANPAHQAPARRGQRL